MWKSYPRPFWPGVISPHLLAGERGCKRAAGEWGPGVWGSPCTRRTYRIPRAASLCPGFAQVGCHDRHPSRSGRADRRPSAPERRGPTVKAWAGVPCESRTRIARRDHRSHYTRRLRLDPTVPPRRSFLQRGQGAFPPATGQIRSALPLAQDSPHRPSSPRRRGPNSPLERRFTFAPDSHPCDPTQSPHPRSPGSRRPLG
jgi:hypothetical protein